MNPLKQGLKRLWHFFSLFSPIVFIHESIKTRVETVGTQLETILNTFVFIHESIKTRVETDCPGRMIILRFESLSMNPLKQGLKLRLGSFRTLPGLGLYP